MADDVVFPISFQNFAAGLHKTGDEVWTKLLRTRHGLEAHTAGEWHQVLRTLKGEPPEAASEPPKPQPTPAPEVSKPVAADNEAKS